MIHVKDKEISLFRALPASFSSTEMQSQKLLDFEGDMNSNDMNHEHWSLHFK